MSIHLMKLDKNTSKVIQLIQTTGTTVLLFTIDVLCAFALSTYSSATAVVLFM